MSANTAVNIDLGRLTDDDLGALESFLDGYKEVYQNAEIRKSTTDLKDGNYTGRLLKAVFEKTVDGKKYILKYELEVLTAKEFSNNDEIGNITQMTQWINVANTASINDEVQRIKQTLYNMGIEIENPGILANKKLSPLPGLVGSEVKFNVKRTKKDENTTYVNVYINGLISKPKTKSAVANSTNQLLEVRDPDYTNQLLEAANPNNATDDDIPF